MGSPAIVIIAILALATLYVLLPRVAYIYRRYRDARILACPETGSSAAVSIDASQAAFSSAFGRPRLRAKLCSLWPARKGCAESCLKDPGVEIP